MAGCRYYVSGIQLTEELLLTSPQTCLQKGKRERERERERDSEGYKVWPKISSVSRSYRSEFYVLHLRSSYQKVGIDL